ncbi:MFS transporter, partial [Acinetobacter baumannii]
MSNEEKSGLKHWVPAFVLMVCVVLAFFDKISIAVLFSDPHFQSSMGIAEDKAKLGWLMTSFLLAYGFSSVFLSFLGDIFNPKKMLFWSVTSWGLLMLCMGFTTSYSGMLILRVLLGLAEG